MRASRIELHIEELVLHGFAPGDRYAVADAVERELTRLLSEQSTQFAGEATQEALVDNSGKSRLDAGAFHAAPDSRPATVGAQIARAIHGGLSK